MAKPKQYSEDQAVAAVHLGSYGFHGKAIAEETGLTTSQVYRICREEGVRLRAYRDGYTPEAAKVKKQLVYPAVDVVLNRRGLKKTVKRSTGNKKVA